MCLRVVGGNNYIFKSFISEKRLILSQILAIFVHFYKILNIRDKNETFCFLMVFTFTSQARRIGSVGSMSASGSAGPGFNP